jgi:hypothetical protein
MKKFKKQKEFTKMLDLGKEDVADLTSIEMSKLNGGLKYPPTVDPGRCPTIAGPCEGTLGCTYSCDCNTLACTGTICMTYTCG